MDVQNTNLMKHDEVSQHVSTRAKILFSLACAAVYFFAFKLNAILFESFNFSHGVNWIFLPSGLRMFFALVLLNSGSVGIILATLLLNYMNGSADSHFFNIVTALISGFAPLIARQICVDYLKVGTNLSNLTSKSLFQISIVFAVVSALLHQVWFFWNQATENFIASSLVMVVGDWFGTVLVLATASLVIRVHRFLTAKR